MAFKNCASFCLVACQSTLKRHRTTRKQLFRSTIARGVVCLSLPLYRFGWKHRHSLAMSAPFWLYYALAALLFDTIFCQTCDGSVGNFDVPITKRSALVTERENDWKLWCTSPFGSTCTRTNRGLTTGHDAVSSQSGSVRDAMVSIEMCYAFCMNRVSALI